MRTRNLIVGCVAGLIAGVLFWPTLYQYHRISLGSGTLSLVRVHRLTGKTAYFTLGGWVETTVPADAAAALDDLRRLSMPAQEPTPSADFQLSQLGEFRSDQFLIDRRSGRVWGVRCSGKPSGSTCSGMTIWEEMFVSGITPADSVAAIAFGQHLLEQEQAKSQGKAPPKADSFKPVTDPDILRQLNAAADPTPTGVP